MIDTLHTEFPILLYVYGFIFSISLGSFYVTLYYRIIDVFYGKPRKCKSFFQKLSLVLFQRSHCENCNKKLNSTELIPVLGYFIVNRKCKQCKYMINIIYPIFEFSMGIIFLLSYFFTENFYLSIYLILFLGHLFLSMYTDYLKFSLDYENIPFLLLFGILLNYEITGVIFNVHDFYVYGGFLVFYILIWFVYKKGTGLGDVLFAPIFAFLAGHPFWLLFLNSSYLLAIVFSFVFRDKNRPIQNMPIPMGLYFGLGTIVCYMGKIYYWKYEVF